MKASTDILNAHHYLTDSEKDSLVAAPGRPHVGRAIQLFVQLGNQTNLDEDTIIAGTELIRRISPEGIRRITEGLSVAAELLDVVNQRAAADMERLPVDEEPEALESQQRHYLELIGVDLEGVELTTSDNQFLADFLFEQHGPILHHPRLHKGYFLDFFGNTSRIEMADRRGVAAQNVRTNMRTFRLTIARSNTPDEVNAAFHEALASHRSTDN